MIGHEFLFSFELTIWEGLHDLEVLQKDSCISPQLASDILNLAGYWNLSDVHYTRIGLLLIAPRMAVVPIFSILIAIIFIGAAS